MSKDYLLDELNKIQKEYLQLLKTVNLEDDLLISIDAMAVFWYKNKPYIDLATDYLFKSYECVMFTAGTSLDVDDNDIYPFLLYGKVHIIDDPIFRIASGGMIDGDKRFSEYMLNSAKDTVNDTIQLLEKYGDLIFVLPIRLFFEMEVGRTYAESEKVFLDLFKNIKTMKEYFEIKTIEELQASFYENGVEKALLFSKEDDVRLDLATRLDNFMKNSKLPKEIGNSVAHVFFMAVFSKISQAIDISRVVTICEIVPFIRDKSALTYLSAMLNHVKNKISNIDLVLYRATLCFLVYFELEREKMVGLTIEQFAEIKKKLNIDTLWNKEKYSLNFKDIEKNTSELLSAMYALIENG